MKPQRPWKALSEVELATAEYVDWYNHRRLHGDIGHAPPAEYETTHYQNNQNSRSQPQSRVSTEPGTVQCRSRTSTCPTRPCATSSPRHR
ncbi:IS3 family transposase [Streptomyces sp. NPDC051286]|uniref:IS3 family transposase n=1 Tax=Streptomyces sp. NPDC051286 TaxID=3365647 RepID=UPI00378AA3BD